MNTTETMWLSFACACIPPDAPEYQYREMRRAFYAGAKTMMCLMCEAAETPTEAAEKTMAELDAELMAFKEAVLRGEA